MDQAREEHQQRERELSQLQSIADGVESITADGEVTLEEIHELRVELQRLRAITKDHL